MSRQVPPANPHGVGADQRAPLEPSTAAQRTVAIERLLQAAFQPQQLQVVDDSHAHAGHRAAMGKGHFRVRVVSTRFAGLTALQRHRLVNEALAPLWQSELHAVSLAALTPDESDK